MTILAKIIKEKEKEVARLQGQTFALSNLKKVPSVKQLFKQEQINIIAEIKRASPSKGTINQAVDPVKQAQRYETLGATAISVLTDQPFFNGSMEDLKAVREAVNLPILCKDFMIDPIQIDQAKAAGANIILLIVGALDGDQLTSLYHYAKDQALDVLVEVHDEYEMERALKLGAEIIGINNRDLKTFTVDLTTTAKLANMVTDPNITLVSESGIRTKADVIQVAKAGAKAILVGETLMRADDLSTTFKELMIPFKEKEV